MRRVAYTHYSFFEWGLIILDVLYDSVSELDFKAANLEVRLFLLRPDTI